MAPIIVLAMSSSGVPAILFGLLLVGIGAWLVRNPDGVYRMSEQMMGRWYAEFNKVAVPTAAFVLGAILVLSGIVGSILG